jgi:hypothetical protein
MNNFYTFIVTACINAPKMKAVNVYGDDRRYEDTLETIASIRKKVPNSKIILIDNSTIPLTEEQINTFTNQVDVFKIIDHNIFTLFVNSIGSKGMGEAYIMNEAIKIMEEQNLIGKRIFKITGRYKLADSFDISFYDNPELIGKYAHKINMWDVSKDNFKNHIQRVVYFETRLWSFCPTILDNYKKLLEKMFEVMVSSIGEAMCNLEMCHWQFADRDKIFELETSHVEGYTADNGLYKFE